MPDPASTDAPPPPSAPKTPLLRGNVLWLSVVSFLNDAASEMIYPLPPLFLAGALRAGPAFLGVVEGVADAVASFLELASGMIADRFGRRSSGWWRGATASPPWAGR